MQAQIPTRPTASHRGALDCVPPRAGAGTIRLAPPVAELDALEMIGVLRKFHRGQGIYAEGDPADYCFRVETGSVRTVGLDDEGRRQIADFFLPGDLLGFESLGVHHLSAEAITDTELRCYPRRAVDLLAEKDCALGRRLHDMALRSLRRAHGKMFLLGRASAGERIAAFLLEMAVRAPTDGGQVELPMTRADIADHLGLTIETVSRIMARLGRDGVIATTKHGVEIRSRKVLSRFGSSTARH